MKHPLKGLKQMAMTGTAPARDAGNKTGRALLAKYRSMRCSLDRSSYGDPGELQEESREIKESLREHRARANSLLLKRK